MAKSKREQKLQMEQTDKQSSKNWFSKLKRSSQFSMSQLAIFIIIFGAIGYFIVHSLATAPLVTSLEAEQMKLPAGGSIFSDTAASGGKAVALVSPAPTGAYVANSYDCPNHPVFGQGTLDPLGSSYLSYFNCVHRLQYFLNAFDNAGLKVNGSDGPLTTAAVTTYQQRNSLTANGTVDSKTWTSLEAKANTMSKQDPCSAHPTLQQGMNDPVGGYNCIHRLQYFLNLYDNAGLKYNGSDGPLTTTAVTTYQKNNSLTANGVVDSNTWTSLESKVSNGTGTPPTNLTLTGTVNFSSSVTSLTVMAKSVVCNGSPQMTVSVDGSAVISNTTVSNTSWTAYSATTNIGSGSHSLTINFTNLYADSNCARTLDVDVSNFYGTPPPTPAPVVALGANPTTVSPGGSSTLNWSASNATSCTASGAWSGSEPTTGSTSTGALNNTSTYRLDCIGPGGTGTNSVTVTVSSGLPLGALLFGDEFNGASGTQPDHSTDLSTTKWIGKTYLTHSTMRWAGWDPKNVSEDGSGNLVITATEDTAGNPGGGWHSGEITGGRPYGYSGQRYLEARAKVACGLGTWSAPIWEWAYPDGSGGLENDVNEQLGRQPTQYNVTLHNWDANITSTSYLVPQNSTQNLCDGFHTYGAAVYKDHVDYYFDGVKVKTILASEIGATDLTTYKEVAVIDLDMGGWGHTIAGDGPYSMLVDYIHVNKLN